MLYDGKTNIDIQTAVFLERPNSRAVDGYCRTKGVLCFKFP